MVDEGLVVSVLVWNPFLVDTGVSKSLQPTRYGGEYQVEQRLLVADTRVVASVDQVACGQSKWVVSVDHALRLLVVVNQLTLNVFLAKCIYC